jgi:hypothetical protein
LNVYGHKMRRAIVALLCAGLSAGLSGCLHKKAKAVVPPQNQAPVALDNPSRSVDETMVEPIPLPSTPVPIAAAAAHPKRERRKPATKATAAAPATPPPPAQVAAAEGLPEGSSIGALTAGGDSSPQLRQEAIDLIASNERRLKALPADIVNLQKPQISKIRNFQRQAQEALDSGDAEGANTLATKAKLLLYDLDRGGS